MNRLFTRYMESIAFYTKSLSKLSRNCQNKWSENWWWPKWDFWLYKNAWLISRDREQELPFSFNNQTVKGLKWKISIQAWQRNIVIAGRLSFKWFIWLDLSYKVYGLKPQNTPTLCQRLAGRDPGIGLMLKLLEPWFHWTKPQSIRAHDRIYITSLMKHTEI